MQVDDSQLNPCSYQAIPVYAMSSGQGLQPAAPIYEANTQRHVDHGLVYDKTSNALFGMPQQGSMQLSSPFTGVYHHHPYPAVPLSAIQPFESCLPASGSVLSGRPEYSQYIVTTPHINHATLPSPAQPSAGNGQWPNTVMPLSLEYPYDIQSFYANSDGTISNLWASTVTPPMRQTARLSSKRSAEEITEQPSDPRASKQSEKRQCLGVTINTDLEPMLTPDSSPASSTGTITDNAHHSPLVPEICTPPAPASSSHLRPRKPVDYLPATPSTSPNDPRRAISAAARAQSITDHVLEIYRSYAKPLEAEGDVKPSVGLLPFIEGYEPVLPAFPELSGDDMMMSDEEDEPEKEIEEQSPGNGKGKGKAGKRSPKSARGQDKVSNRVAARRHREMTKERLKNLEKLRSWLDDALTEYEKSNRVLQNNFQQLQNENHNLQRNLLIPVQQST